MTHFKFEWRPEDGIAICRIEDRDHIIYEGKAKCHEDDKDMMNEKTGCEIALMKALIKYQKAQMRNTKYELKGLKQLLHSIDTSSRYTPGSYEAIMLRKQIEIKEYDIEAYKESIHDLNVDLKVYTTSKEVFYKTVRNIRREKELEKMHEEGLI